MRKIVAMLTLVALAMMGTASAHEAKDDPSKCKGEWVSTHQHVDAVVTSEEVHGPFDNGVTQGTTVSITDAKTGPFYLEVRDVQSHFYVFSIWLYQETNNWNYLQRGKRSIFPDTPTTSGEDPCNQWGGVNQAPAPDTAIF